MFYNILMIRIVKLKQTTIKINNFIILVQHTNILSCRMNSFCIHRYVHRIYIIFGSIHCIIFLLKQIEKTSVSNFIRIYYCIFDSINCMFIRADVQ